MPLLGFNFDLRQQLTFYGSYHSNPINQAIHAIFVPLILWTVAVWLAYTPPLFHCELSFLPSSSLAQYLVFDGAFILLASFSLYYSILEPIAGTTWAIFIALPIWATAEAFQRSFSTAWQWALCLHVLSWFMQIYFGHTLAEKRRPALLDSFFQSLVLAPLFVWFELLFLLGYRKDLARDVAAGSAENIKAFYSATAPLLGTHDATPAATTE